MNLGRWKCVMTGYFFSFRYSWLSGLGCFFSLFNIWVGIIAAQVLLSLLKCKPYPKAHITTLKTLIIVVNLASFQNNKEKQYLKTYNFTCSKKSVTNEDINIIPAKTDDWIKRWAEFQWHNHTLWRSYRFESIKVIFCKAYHHFAILPQNEAI